MWSLSRESKACVVCVENACSEKGCLDLTLNKALGSVVDVLSLGEGQLLEVGGVGHGDISASDTDSGGVEVVEGSRLVDGGKDLSADAVLGPALLNGHEEVGLDDGLDDSVAVKGTDATQVDDLSANALLGELVGSLKSKLNRARDGDDGQIGTLTLNLGLAEGGNVVLAHGLVAHVELSTVHELVLEENDGVGVADGGLHHTLGVLSTVRHEDLETGHGAVPGAEALGVLGTDTGSSTVGSTEDNRHVAGTGSHVKLLGGRVNNLIDGLHGKVEGHELDDRAKTLVGGTGGKTGETHLSDRGVNDTGELAALVELFNSKDTSDHQ